MTKPKGEFISFKLSPRDFSVVADIAKRCTLRVEDYCRQLVENHIAEERGRRFNPDDYKMVHCPKCGAEQWINVIVKVDFWRCRRCMGDLGDCRIQGKSECGVAKEQSATTQTSIRKD